MSEQTTSVDATIVPAVAAPTLEATLQQKRTALALISGCHVLNHLQYSITAVIFPVMMAELGFEIDLSAQVWQMPLAIRQQLEILRTLAIGAKLLILDEPTSVLAPPETVRLFQIVRRIAASGRAVVLISHNMSDVFEVSDRIATLYLGRLVADLPAAELTHSQVVELITAGRSGDLGLARPDAVTI